MVIKTDTIGKAGIEWLCDIAFKTGGIRAREKCNQILDAIELIKEKEDKDA